MEPVGKLKLQSWMTERQTVAVMRALMADDVPARFVGGCVRDAILDRTVQDIDIATAEPPDRVISLLEIAGLKAIPTGIDHGTITAVAQGTTFEITTLRRDVETFGRRAQVAFTDDWVVDAERRDFTMNALYCDLDGTVFDPTGGWSDLKAGIVRFVGEPRKRLQEDLLRLLRFFRFYAYYGTGPADRDALSACQEMAPGIGNLSAERIWSELKRLLVVPTPNIVLDLMADWHVLEHVLPDAGSRGLLACLADLETKTATKPDPIRRLSILLAIDDAGATNLARRLRLSKAETHLLQTLVTPSAQPLVGNTDAQNRIVLYQLGEARFKDLVLLGWAADSTADDAKWTTLKGLPARMPIPDFPLKGEDVLGLGIESGRIVGELLSDAERWWVDNNFRPNRAACLKQLENLAHRIE